jgi:hypothetical protein
VSDVSDDPMEFSRAESSTAPITAPSFDEATGICATVAMVDTRRVLRARDTTARGVHMLPCFNPFPHGSWKGALFNCRENVSGVISFRIAPLTLHVH